MPTQRSFIQPHIYISVICIYCIRCGVIKPGRLCDFTHGLAMDVCVDVFPSADRLLLSPRKVGGISSVTRTGRRAQHVHVPICYMAVKPPRTFLTILPALHMVKTSGSSSSSSSKKRSLAIEACRGLEHVDSDNISNKHYERHRPEATGRSTRTVLERLSPQEHVRSPELLCLSKCARTWDDIISSS